MSVRVCDECGSGGGSSDDDCIQFNSRDQCILKEIQIDDEGNNCDEWCAERQEQSIDSSDWCLRDICKGCASCISLNMGSEIRWNMRHRTCISDRFKADTDRMCQLKCVDPNNINIIINPSVCENSIVWTNVN